MNELLVKWLYQLYITKQKEMGLMPSIPSINSPEMDALIALTIIIENAAKDAGVNMREFVKGQRHDQ